MRAAIVGFGTAGEARLGAYAPIGGVTVVAVVDPSRARRERAATLDPTVRTHASIVDLVAAGGVDVVDVCSPPAYHRDLTLGALAAGMHVICEKPVAYRNEDAEVLTTASRVHRRLLYPAHNYRFSPIMRVLERFVERADGGPLAATFEIMRDRHARGVGDYAPDWRRDPAQAGGGILMDHGSHCVYMATRLFGGAPDTVRCVAQWAGGDPASGIDESIHLTLEFPTGQCVIRLSWTSDLRTNLYVIYGPDSSVVVAGDTAEIRDPAGVRTVALTSPTRNSTHEEWFAAMFADFTEVVDRPLRWDQPLDEIATTAAVLAAAYESAHAGGEAVEVAAGRALASR